LDGSGRASLVPNLSSASVTSSAWRASQFLMTAKRDVWAEWLAEGRFGGDTDVKREVLETLGQTRDEVFDRAGLAEAETLLDVGCGEGLIGFGALERGAARVIFSDISEDLLAFCREAAE